MDNCREGSGNRQHERVSGSVGGYPAAPPVVPGYVLEEVLGHGASSTVWSARSQVTGGRVAVKVTPASLRYGQQVVDAAVRERAVLAAVVSEHVVRLHETRRLDNGAVALVLDLADGGSLHDLVSIRGALPPGEVVTIVTSLATTLGELHAAGVIHADLSPGNVLFTAEGKPMLSDYDAARLVGEQHPHRVAGTSGFVAPEVERGGLPMEASDVWSLAALAWYALAGGSPPPTDCPLGVAEEVVGPEFARLLARMLAAEPRDRPSASACAVASYRAAEPVPVRLAGRNLDAATAMTHRIRREAAVERRTRAELRAADRSAARCRRWPRPMPLLGGRFRPRRPARFRSGIAMAFLLAALVLVTGLLVSPALVRDGTVPASGRPGVEPSSAVGEPSRTGAADPVALLRADPHGVVQRIALARAEALTRGDPAALVDAESLGSPAHQGDVTLLAQLQSRQQRYADLAFRVRSAEVVRVDAGGAEVLAVVDRAACAVVGPGDARQELPPSEGRALRYSLVPTEQGWRLSAVSDA